MDYRYFYYVEGQCEKKLIDLLKEHQLILPGRIEVFNATQDLFNSARLRLLPPRSVVILIFDTDTGELNETEGRSLSPQRGTKGPSLCPVPLSHCNKAKALVYL